MIKLLKIEAAPDKKDKYILRFQDDTSLVCGAGELVDFRLHQNTEIEPEEYEKLRQACVYFNVRQKAASLLSLRPMSAGELKQKLIEKGSGEENAEKAVDWLTGLGIINDAEYAASVARHYAQKGYGRGKIRDEFFKRRIPRALWEDALEDIPDNEDKIDKYINTKLRGGTMDITSKRKIADGLRRRGFSWDEIKSAIARYIDDNDFTED